MRRYVWFGCVLLAGVVLAAIASASVSARELERIPAGIPVTPFPTGSWGGPGGFVDPDRIVSCGVPVVYSGDCEPFCMEWHPDEYANQLVFGAYSPCGSGQGGTPTATAFWQPTPVSFDTPTPGGTAEGTPTTTVEATPSVTLTVTPDGTPTATPEPGWWFDGPYMGFYFDGCGVVDYYHDEPLVLLDRPMGVLAREKIWTNQAGGNDMRLKGNPAFPQSDWAWESSFSQEYKVDWAWWVYWASGYGVTSPMASGDVEDFLGVPADGSSSFHPIDEGGEFPRPATGSWYLRPGYSNTCLYWEVSEYYVMYYGLEPTPEPTPTPSPTPSTDLCRIMQPAVLASNEGVRAHVGYNFDIEPLGLSPFGYGYVSTTVTYTVSAGQFNMVYELDPSLCIHEGWGVEFWIYRDGEWTDEPGDGGDVGIDPTITPGACYVLVPQISNPFNSSEFIFPGLELCLFYVDPNINLPLLGDPMPYLAPVVALLVGLLLHRMLRD